MDGSSKPPQISELFQKFALAFKAKTFELFTEDEGEDRPFTYAAAAAEDSHDLSLLDSAEEFITDQKVVVIKPDSAFNPSPSMAGERRIRHEPNDAQIAQTLIPCLFATVSCFEASYLQLQAAHAPFDEEGIKAADRAILSHFNKWSDVKRFHSNLRGGVDSNLDLAIGSCSDLQVQENQSRLRALETVVNRLQSEIDSKHVKVLALRRDLSVAERSNLELSKKMSGTSMPLDEVLLSVSVFDSFFRDAIRCVCRFTKLLINLMKKAGWDLDLAAKSIYPGVEYARMGHNRYALLSFVCMGMFQGFHSQGFGVGGGNEILCNGNSLSSCKHNSLNQLVEHLSAGSMEALSWEPSSDFSLFCKKKYRQIVHPALESSIFNNLGSNERLCPWRSMSVLYQAFVGMASSIWMLHKLAFSFDPAVEIFQVKRGVGFSFIYMEDATRRCRKTKSTVGFSVVPGFKVGKTVIQSRVYLIETKSTNLQLASPVHT